MLYGSRLLAKLVNREKIIACIFIQMNFKAVINSEVKIQYMIKIPAKTVLFQSGYNAQQTGILKKFFQHCLVIKTQFHFLFFHWNSTLKLFLSLPLKTVTFVESPFLNLLNVSI